MLPHNYEEHRNYILREIITPKITLNQLLTTVDNYGPLEFTLYGKYKVTAEKIIRWQDRPIYNMGYIDVS